MNDPFDTLGVSPTFDLDLGALEKRYRDLSRVLHPDRHVGEGAAQRRMSLGKAVEVNEAWRVLRDPIQRAQALLRRAGVRVVEGQEPKASGAFLMDVMERREALAEARAARDAKKLERLAGEIRALEAQTTRKLADGFASAAGEVAAAEALVPLVGELRYHRRFLDEVSAIEDELSGDTRETAG